MTPESEEVVALLDRYPAEVRRQLRDELKRMASLHGAFASLPRRRAWRRELLSPCCRSEEKTEHTTLVGEGRQERRCLVCGRVRGLTMEAIRRENTRPALRLVRSDGTEVRS